jgi:probable O-glycosylation ligase (exosortase A-associated)
LRDLFVTAVIFGSLPVILFRPFLGVVMWTWISLMSPHRLAWGFAINLPFAKMVAIVTILALLISPERKRFPVTRETVLLLLFVLWMIPTTVFALEQEQAWVQFEKVAKIQLLVFVTMAFMTNKSRLNLFLWMIVLSVGFYGVKGGLFTIRNGGESHVLGPPESFIEDNNHLGLALVMVIPLMRYLQLTQPRRWVRLGLGGAMVLSAIATLGTQSRGAFLGLLAMFAFLGFKSRGRLAFASVALVMAPFVLGLMPDAWYERMETIYSYDQDESAMGRINAWWFAARLAYDRPLVGGGFEVFTERWFAVYAPKPEDDRDAHSIYFEVLGEQGFVGLFLFVVLGLLVWRACAWINRHAMDVAGMEWASDLARTCQVSLVGYATAGAFVGLAYFDLYYNVIALIVVTKLLVLGALQADSEERLDEYGTEMHRQRYRRPLET